MVSDRFKHNDDGFKYFIAYEEGELVKPSCIILPQMNGYIKYFENGEKSKSKMIMCWINAMKFGTKLKGH